MRATAVSIANGLRQPVIGPSALSNLDNVLYFGDNLDVLQRHVKDESVDLVYLDPPFKSEQDYNVLFQERDGTQAAAQVKAFHDTWRWDRGSAEAFQELVARGDKVSEAMVAFERLLGHTDMLAYLSMMAPRLIELHRVLKNSGSIFLHCDPAASHYLKVLMDSAFGPHQFRNEIIWRRTGAHGPRRTFGPIHDTILFFSKTDQYYFHPIYRPYMRGHVEGRYKKESSGKHKFSTGGNILTGAGATRGESGMTWRGFDPSAKNRHWAVPGYLAKQMPPEFEKLSVLKKLEALYEKGLLEITEGNEWPSPVRYLEDDPGQSVQDLWAYQPYTEKTVFGTDEGIDHDVAWLGPTDPERLGYPTQKPRGLLERIIAAASPADGVVLDPFCGCGTTIEAAQTLGRRWIGIDITNLAITLIKHRLKFGFGDKVSYKVVGEPVTLPDAEGLAKIDPFQFQWWALGLVDARPIEQKKGADKGIDGKRFFFPDQFSTKAEQIIFSVKSGHADVKDIRDLRGVVEREKAAIGVLLTLQQPTSAMKKEALGAGFYEAKDLSKKKYPRLQIFTIKELLAGSAVECPPYARAGGAATFKAAPEVKKLTTKAVQLGTFASEKAAKDS